MFYGSVGRYGVCHGKVVDLGHVEITARYSDCSVFNCPNCGAKGIDDRDGVHLRKASKHEIDAFLHGDRRKLVFDEYGEGHYYQ